jgi:hypothetical protein
MQRSFCECCGEPVAPAPVPTTQIEAREWNGYPIHRREADGYVNATAMCQANHKRWNDYARMERTEAYIAALAADAGFPVTGLVVSIRGGRPDLQGTWIHPRLAVDLARWISPQFAVWMDGWFLEQFQPSPLPTTTNHRGILGNPRIVIHAASEQEAAACWEQAVASTVLDGLIHHRQRALRRGGSPRYEVAFTA